MVEREGDLNRWFRFYQGTCEDGKFRMVARNAEVTVATVIGVWACLLEDAAHPDHRGIAVRGEDFYAAILDLTPQDVQHILQFMEEVDCISVGHGAITISNWKERQFETDSHDPTNADRQRKWREKHKPNKPKQERNGRVTETKRPETEADTETEAEKKEPTLRVADPRTKLFNESLRTLASITGKTPDSCRSLVGRWLKLVNDEAIHVIAAIEDAERNRIADPVAWINQTLKPRGTNGKTGNVIDAADRLIQRIADFDKAPDESGVRSGTGENLVRLLPPGRSERP
jgi:hypothetical protein